MKPLPLRAEALGLYCPGASSDALLHQLRAALRLPNSEKSDWSIEPGESFAVARRGEAQLVHEPGAPACQIRLWRVGGVKLEQYQTGSIGCDTDAIAMGSRATNPLCGAFSIVVRDDTADLLHLWRDRVGLQPLYVARLSNGIAFGNDVPPLLHLLGSRASELDDAGIAAHALEDWKYVTRTVYRHIHVVPPGCRLTIGRNIERCERWWPGPLRHAPWKDWNDGVDAVRAAVFDAVESNAHHGGSIAIDVSGGIDSACIWAAANTLSRSHRLTAPNIVAASLRFPGLACDESAQIDSILRRIPGHSVDAVGAAPTLDNCQKEAAHTGLPPYTLIAMHAGLAESLYHRGISVRVSGEGGDELFKIGAGRAIQLGLLDRGVSKLACLRSIIAHISRKPDVITRPFAWVAGTRPIADWQQPVRNQFTSQSLAHMSRALDTSEAIPVPPIKTGVAQADYLFHRFAAGWYAYGMDGAMRAHAFQGIEFRCPLLDHRLLETCATMPFDWLDGMQSINRALLRDAFATDLPREILQRTEKAEFSAVFSKFKHDFSNNYALTKPLHNLGIERVPASENVAIAKDNTLAGYGLLELELWNNSRKAAK